MKRILVVGFSVVLLAGCASKEAQLEGKWDLSTETRALGTDAKNPSDAMRASMAKAYASMTTVEFKSDKTFAMNMYFLVTLPIEGTWKMSGKTVTLTPTKIMGLTPDQLKARVAKGPISAGTGDVGVQGGGTLQDPDEITRPMTATISDNGKGLTLAFAGVPMAFKRA